MEDPPPEVLERALSAPSAALSEIETPSEKIAFRRLLWALGAHAGALSDFKASDLADAPLRDLIVHAAIALEAGKMPLAAKLIEAAEAQKPITALDLRFVSLIEFALAFLPAVGARLTAFHPALEALKRGRGAFRRLVQTPETSICVVGNAPRLKGSGLGSWIDGHDVVIRFNAYVTTPELVADTGTKCDIWIRSPNYVDQTRRDVSEFSCIAQTGIPLYWRSPLGAAVLSDAGRTNVPIDGMEPHDYQCIFPEWPHRPSQGLATLGWLRLIRGSLADTSIVGFSLSDQSSGSRVRYFRSALERDRIPHAWDKERALLRTWLTEDGAELT